MAATLQNLTGTVNITQNTSYADDLVGDDVVFNVAAAAVLSIAGDDAFTASTFAGPGEIQTSGDTKLSAVAVSDDATFGNAGVITQSGDLTDAAFVRNAGTWNLGADDRIVGVGATAKFVNFGAFDAASSPGSSNVISTDFLDYGSLAFGGALEFSGAQTLINSGGISGTSGDAIDIAAGNARFRFLTPFSVNNSNLGGLSGAFTVSAGARVDFAGNPALVSKNFTFGVLTMDAGARLVVDASTTLSLEGQAVIAGVIRGAGALLMATPTALQNGARVLSGGAFIECDVSGRVFLGAAGAGARTNSVVLNGGTLVTDQLTINGGISGQGEIVNHGNLQIPAQYPLSVGAGVNIFNTDNLFLGGHLPQVSVTLGASDILTNAAKASLVLEADDSFQLTGGTIVNNGGLAMLSMMTPLVKGGAYATADIASLVDNNGGILSGAGITFSGAVEGSGVDAITSVITAGPTLTAIEGQGFTFDAAVSVGQTVAFSASNQLVTLNDLAGFAATIADFDQNGAADDRIVVNTSLWTFQDFAPNAQGTGGALIFTDGAAEASVNLTGAYDPAKFHAAVSGGQTTITYG